MANLRVVIRDELALFSSDLTPKDSDGRFPVQYADDATPELGGRKLGVYVFTQGHRLLYHDLKDRRTGRYTTARRPKDCASGLEIGLYHARICVEMSTTASGHVIDDHGDGVPNLLVHLTDDSALLRSQIGKTKTLADGSFSIGPYDEDPYFGTVFPPRTFTLTVVDLRSMRNVHTEALTDSMGTLNLGNISISSPDLNAFIVSGGVGAADRLTAGNAVHFLIDNLEAWGRFSDLVGKATKSGPLHAVGVRC